MSLLKLTKITLQKYASIIKELFSAWTKEITWVEAKLPLNFSGDF